MWPQTQVLLYVAVIYRLAFYTGGHKHRFYCMWLLYTGGFFCTLWPLTQVLLYVAVIKLQNCALLDTGGH